MTFYHKINLLISIHCISSLFHKPLANMVNFLVPVLGWLFRLCLSQTASNVATLLFRFVTIILRHQLLGTMPLRVKNALWGFQENLARKEKSEGKEMLVKKEVKGMQLKLKNCSNICQNALTFSDEFHFILWVTKINQFSFERLWFEDGNRQISYNLWQQIRSWKTRIFVNVCRSKVQKLQ